MAGAEPFQASEVPEPFSGGPYLLVALPESMEPIVPLNATKFLIEWEQMLDPKAAVAEAARMFLAGNEDWRVGDRFVVPTFTSPARIRDLADEDRVTEAFERSNGVFHQGDQEIPISQLSDDHSETRLPVLLGLAVLATLHEIGYAGRWLWERYEADEQRIKAVRLAATERAMDRRAKAEDERVEGIIERERPEDVNVDDFFR